MAQLTAIEKLARRICWVEFSPAGRKGKTEASYWNAITPAIRAEIIREIKRILWVIDKAPVEILVDAYSEYCRRNDG